MTARTIEHVHCLQVAAVPIMGKMAGAVGNYNAHISAYPEVLHPCRTSWQSGQDVAASLHASGSLAFAYSVVWHMCAASGLGLRALTASSAAVGTSSNMLQL